MAAAIQDDEKKASDNKGDEPSELATVLKTSADTVDSVLSQLSTLDNKEVKTLITTLKSDLASAQHLGQASDKKNSELESKVSVLRKKFGALKWASVERKGDPSQGYPKPARGDTVDVFTNGDDAEVKVSDPYRWLEDPDSAESRAWIDEQCDVTDAYLSQCSAVQPIYDAMMQNLNFARYGTPTRKGADPAIYYYTLNSGLQNQSVLYFHEKSLDAPQKCLLDPNTLSEDGTTSAAGYYFSEDAKLLCYGLSKAGSDWKEFHVKEVLTGKKLPDVIEWCKFTGITWTHDNAGFFYSRYSKPASNTDENKKGTETDKLKNQQLYYHSLGTAQSEDIFLVDGNTLGGEEWMVGAGLTCDGKYVELYISDGCDPVNRLYLVDISDKLAFSSADEFQKRMVKLVDNFDYGYDVLNNEGTMFYFKTNNSAGNYRVVSYDIGDFDDAKNNEIAWTEIVPERKFRLESASVVGGAQAYLLLKYNEDVKTVIKLIDLKGNAVKHNIKFPAAGSIGSTGSKKHTEGFFSFTSFLYPGSKYSYDYTTHTMKVWKEVEVQGFSASDYETKQVFYPSKDGTKIPMYILSPKGLVLDGTNPTIIYGYGGFDISLNPSFSVSRVLWLKHTRGVYVSANLRGGGEYGESWHSAGTKAQKQNVFDDLHAAGEWLIKNQYTNPTKLAIEGGSNGGLLVSAACNQRPDLYRVGVANCGVLDMLRFHKFTIGYAWCSDYGCADKKDEFDALYAYSPLLNIPTEIGDSPFPCYMATTADHDDRVSPLHSFKFVAELQHRLGGNEKQTNPLLIRIEVKSGHGSSSLTKGIEIRADTMAFIVKCLGAEWK